MFTLCDRFKMSLWHKTAHLSFQISIGWVVSKGPIFPGVIQHQKKDLCKASPNLPKRNWDYFGLLFGSPLWRRGFARVSFCSCRLISERMQLSLFVEWWLLMVTLSNIPLKPLKPRFVSWPQLTQSLYWEGGSIFFLLGQSPKLVIPPIHPLYLILKKVGF